MEFVRVQMGETADRNFRCSRPTLGACCASPPRPMAPPDSTPVPLSAPPAGDALTSGQHGATPEVARLGAERSLRRRSYARPPVVEAIVEITTRHAEAVGLSTLERVTDGDETRYPTRQPLVVADFTIDQATGQFGNQRQQVSGYVYVTAQPVTATVQVRQDGFLFSQRAPTPDAYPATGWDEWHGEAARLWDKYVAVTRPTEVTQLRVRYVNRLIIPSVEFLVPEYFTLYPQVPTDFAPEMAGYLFRVALPRPGVPGAMLTITQGVLDQAQAPAGNTGMLLDIDVVCRRALPPGGPDVWGLLHVLHAHVIDAFEASVTDTARELFT